MNHQIKLWQLPTLAGNYSPHLWLAGIHWRVIPELQIPPLLPPWLWALPTRPWSENQHSRGFATWRVWNCHLQSLSQKFSHKKLVESPPSELLQRGATFTSFIAEIFRPIDLKAKHGQSTSINQIQSGVRKAGIHHSVLWDGPCSMQQVCEFQETKETKINFSFCW